MPKRPRQSAASVPFQIELDGQTFAGEYRVEGGMVYVTSQYGPKATQVGNSDAESVAKRLLHNLVASFEEPGKVQKDLRRPKLGAEE